MKMWVERSYPYVAGVAAGLASVVSHRLSILDTRQSSEILKNVFQLTAVGLGFWSTSATLLLAVEHKSLMKRLKKGPHFRILVGYIFAAITCLALLLTVTLLGMFLGDKIKLYAHMATVFACSWFAVLVIAVATTFRAYYILSQVLKIAATDEESS